MTYGLYTGRVPRLRGVEDEAASAAGEKSMSAVNADNSAKVTDFSVFIASAID